MKAKAIKQNVLILAKIAFLFVGISIIAIGCASKSNTLPDDPKLAESDLFDGLKEGDNANHASTEDPLTKLEDGNDANKFADDNIVKDGEQAGASSGKSYDYYYVAVGGEKIGRLAYAIYNDKHAINQIYKMNPNLKGMKQVAADTKIYFSMKRANPRSEFLTKDMVERYKQELRAKIQERRNNASGNTDLAQVTIQKGDTLQIISQRLYGTTRLWTELFLVNQEKLGAYDNLKVGTVLAYYPVIDFHPANNLANSNAQEAAPIAPSADTFAKNDTPPAPPVEPVKQAAMETPPPATPVEVKPMEANPAPVEAKQTNLPGTVKVTETPAPPNGDDPVVKGGIPVDPSTDMALDHPGGPARNAGKFGESKRIRPAEPEQPEESFFSRNFRRFIYIGFIALIVFGGYYLTQSNGAFKKNKFAGIQPLPGGGPARPRMPTSSSTPTTNRVVVNRTGPPPNKVDSGQKTG